MKALRDHITEAEQWINDPAVGDEFAINIREECLLESYIVAADAHELLLDADDRMLALLEQYDMLENHEPMSETIRRYGAVGSSAGRGYTLEQHGGAQRPGIIGRTPPEPALDIDPEAVGSIRELPDGTREERTATGWKVVSGPNPSRPRAIEEGQLMQRMLELAGCRRVEETAPDQPETNAAHTDPLAAKAADLAPVGTEKDPGTATTIDEVAMTQPHKQLQDYKSMTSQQFQSAHGMSKADWAMKHLDLLAKHGLQVDWTGKSAFDFVKDDKSVQPIDESVMSGIDMDLRHIAKTERMDALVDAMRGEFGIHTQQYLQDMMDDVDQTLDKRGMQNTNMHTKLSMLMDTIRELYAQEDLDEAEYQGRDVKLNKPKRGGSKKFYVYVKDPKSGNVRKISFGDPNMKIKKSNPDRRRSFRARHRCASAKDKTSARYWSCKAW